MSPASSTSRCASSGSDDVGLDGAAADLRRDLLRLVGARAVADDDLRAGARELERDRAPDARASRR